MLLSQNELFLPHRHRFIPGDNSASSLRLTTTHQSPDGVATTNSLIGIESCRENVLDPTSHFHQPDPVTKDQGRARFCVSEITK